MRMANNLMFLFKIIHRFFDLDFDKYFSFIDLNFNNRGHSMKLNVNYSRLECRKHFFCDRAINICNVLPASFINLRSFDSLK